MNLINYFSKRKKIVDDALDKLLTSDKKDKAQSCNSDSALNSRTLYEAVRYSVFAGGKRIRPILMMAACEAVAGELGDVLVPACAIEMIHTYSLIHDDLPAMDDDALRRGKPTCHKAYGEATAILAGDALLTEAFAVVSSEEFVKKVKPEIAISVVRGIATAAGYKGMVLGQMIDMEMQGGDIDFARLEYLHIHKTGALLLACVKVGATIGGATKGQLCQLIKYGECIGLAFQIADDILDVVGDSKVIGKEAGMDSKHGKITYPKVVGLHEAKNIAEGLISSALESIKDFGKEADPLRRIARFIIEREK